MPSPLLVVLSSDGLPFFRAQDVGKILNYKNLHYFSNRHAKLKIEDIVYKKLGLPRTVLKTRVFSLEETLDVLKKSKKWTARLVRFWLGNPEKVQVLPPREIRASSDPRRCMQIRMMVDDCTNRTTLANFLEKFKMSTLELYDRMARDCFMKKKEIHVFEDSLDKMLLPEPPRVLMVHFGSEMHAYQLI